MSLSQSIRLMLMDSVASVKTLEDVKSDPHCLYIAMPVQVRLFTPNHGVEG
jgi:hypothetical protein